MRFIEVLLAQSTQKHSCYVPANDSYALGKWQVLVWCGECCYVSINIRDSNGSNERRQEFQRMLTTRVHLGGRK